MSYERMCGYGRYVARSKTLTISIVFHSLLRILLMSPVRIIWFAAEICGLRFLAKIMKAFIGRLGVPSAFSVWDVSAR